MSKKIAVIGLGNILRRDDGIGIRILESLLQFYKREGIDYFNFGIASFDLIHRLQAYNRVLLIDAMVIRHSEPPCFLARAGRGTKNPGKVTFFELKDIKYNLKNSVTSTHELNLKDLFELAKKFKLKTKIYVAGIQVENISWFEGLTDSLEKRKEDIVKQVSAFIDTCITKDEAD